MKRYISKYDEKHYTHMRKLIETIGGENLKYHWLISDIEAYPTDKTINDKIENEYLLLSNNELLDILKQEDFQWINATFSAIPKKEKTKDILQYSLPTVDKATLHYKETPTIQHPLAEIEIDCVDSSFFAITVKNEKQMKNLNKVFPKLLESIDSPEDYFTSRDNRTDYPTIKK